MGTPLRLAAGLAFGSVFALAACGVDLDGDLPSKPDAGTDGGDAADVGAAGDATLASDGAGASDGTIASDAADDDAGAIDDAGDSAPAPPEGGSDAAPTGAGTALLFSSASGSYVDMGNVAVPGTFTLEAWVRPTALPTAEADVVAKDRNGDANDQFRLVVEATGKVAFMMSDNTGNDHGLYAGGYKLLSNDALPLATWTHLAVTKEQTTFALYFGTTLEAAVATSGDVAPGGALAFRVGGRLAADGGADGVFDGAIDEVRLWKAARNAGQLAVDLRRELATTDVDYTDLVGYWRFDDGSGATASDSKSGAGPHAGTLVAGPKWIVSTAF